MGILLHWVILTLAVWLTATILPGVHVRSAGSALVVAAIFGVLNWALGWLFFVVLTVLTLGIAWLLSFITVWLINAVLLKFTAALTDRFRIDSFGWALGAALLISLISSVGNWLFLGRA